MIGSRVRSTYHINSSYSELVSQEGDRAQLLPIILESQHLVKGVMDEGIDDVHCTPPALHF